MVFPNPSLGRVECAAPGRVGAKAIRRCGERCRTTLASVSRHCRSLSGHLRIPSGCCWCSGPSAVSRFHARRRAGAGLGAAHCGDSRAMHQEIDALKRGLSGHLRIASRTTERSGRWSSAASPALFDSRWCAVGTAFCLGRLAQNQRDVLWSDAGKTYPQQVGQAVQSLLQSLPDCLSAVRPGGPREPQDSSEESRQSNGSRDRREAAAPAQNLPSGANPHRLVSGALSRHRYRGLRRSNLSHEFCEVGFPLRRLKCCIVPARFWPRRDDEQSTV